MEPIEHETHPNITYRIAQTQARASYYLTKFDVETNKPVQKDVAHKSISSKPVQKDVAHKPISSKPVQKNVARKPISSKPVQKDAALKPISNKPVQKDAALKPISSKPVQNDVDCKPISSKPENVDPTFLCALEKLKPYVPKKYLNRGYMGSIYEACKVGNSWSADDCNYVIKVTQMYKTRDEIKYTELAAEHGIGPKVFGSVSCKNNDEMFEFIVMEKLSGPSLEAAYPYKREDVHSALKLYWDFYQKANIFQNDPKAENFMFTIRDGIQKLVMIDYGIATPGDKTPYEHMRKIAIFLFRSLVGPRWYKDKDLIQKAEVWKNVANGVKDFFDDHFPDRQQKYICVYQTANLQPLFDASVSFKNWFKQYIN